MEGKEHLPRFKESEAPEVLGFMAVWAEFDTEFKVQTDRLLLVLAEASMSTFGKEEHQKIPAFHATFRDRLPDLAERMDDVVDAVNNLEGWNIEWRQNTTSTNMSFDKDGNPIHFGEIEGAMLGPSAVSHDLGIYVGVKSTIEGIEAGYFRLSSMRDIKLTPPDDTMDAA